MSWTVMICLLEVFIDLCFGRTHKPTQCVSVYFTLHLLYPPQPARPEKRGLLASPQMERLLSPRKLASLQESIWRNYGINLSGMSMHHVHQCTDATFCPKQKVLSRLLKLTSFWQPEKLNIWGVAIAPLNLASCCTRLAGTCIHHKPWCGHAQSPLRHQITSTRVYTRTCSCKFLCPSIYIYDHIQSYTIIYIAFAAVLMYVDRYTCTRAYTHKYTNVISHPTSTSTFVLVSEIHPSVRATMNLWAYIIDYIREWRLKS